MQRFITRDAWESDNRIDLSWLFKEEDSCDYCMHKETKTCDYCSYNKKRRFPYFSI